MTQKKITAPEALEYLCRFYDLFAGTEVSEWQKLPFYAFFKARESIWVYLDDIAIDLRSINDVENQELILTLFFELLEEINSKPNEKYILADDPDFFWINILWSTNEISLNSF
jgi:hypothetical protein